MTGNKAPKTYRKFIEALTEQFLEVEFESPEEVDEFLREAGIDPDEFAVKMQKVAEDAIKNSPLNWRNQAHKLIAEARMKLEGRQLTTVLSREEIDATLHQLFEKLRFENSQVIPLHFRNFEAATDEDRLSLINELEYLLEQEN